MLFHYLFLRGGLNRFHSPDLADMRDALLDEDQDGPDGGSADIAPRMVLRQHRKPDRLMAHGAGQWNRPGPQKPPVRPDRRVGAIRGQRA